MGRIVVAPHATMNAFGVRSVRVVCLLLLGIGLMALFAFKDFGESTLLTQNSVKVLWHGAPTSTSESCNHKHEQAAPPAQDLGNNQPAAPVTVTVTATVTATLVETKAAPAATTTGAPAVTAKKRMNFNMLNREEKQRIAMHLQDVVRDYQEEYVQYMKAHVYGNPPLDVEESGDPELLKVYKQPAQHKPSLKCEAHEPGLVPVNDQSRQFCFGSAAVKGKRVCDRHVPDYTTLHDTKTGYDVYELYGKKFAFIPFFHKSKFTRNSADDVELRNVSVTATSQGSWNRIEHVKTLAPKYHGPISFALLLDSADQLDELPDIIAEDPDVARFVDMHVAWRLDHTVEDEGSFYPINMLRNMALQNVMTGRVLVMDVDNIPSGPMKDFQKWMTEAEEAVVPMRNESACPGLEAFIPPALEMSAERVAKLYEDSESTIRMYKRLLIEGFFDGSVVPMHVYFGPAYVPQNHFEWAYSNKVEEINYITRFEPYYVTRMPVPLFNETFVDRGGNKAQQAYEMYAAGYRFFRLPQGFMVDIPHEHNESKEKSEAKMAEKSALLAAKAAAGKLVHRRRARAAADAGEEDEEPAVIDNATEQAALKEDFIAQLWADLHDYLPHRYGRHLPNPAVTDPEFKKYRRAQEKIINSMWHLLAMDEQDDDRPDLDDHQVE